MREKYILISICSAIITLLILFIINYFTGFLYYIPREPIVIYQYKSQDIFVDAHPAYIVLDKEPLPLEINTCYPIYGKDFVNHEWSVIFETEYIGLPPEDFPLTWRYIEDMNRLVIDIPDENITYENKR